MFVIFNVLKDETGVKRFEVQSFMATKNFMVTGGRSELILAFCAIDLT